MAKQTIEVEGCDFCSAPAAGAASVKAHFGIGAGRTRTIFYCVPCGDNLFTTKGLEPVRGYRPRFVHELAEAFERHPAGKARK
jgi:hypothetical protein